MKLDPNKLKKAESFDLLSMLTKPVTFISENPEIQTPPQ